MDQLDQLAALSAELLGLEIEQRDQEDSKCQTQTQTRTQETQNTPTSVEELGQYLGVLARQISDEQLLQQLQTPKSDKMLSPTSERSMPEETIFTIRRIELQDIRKTLVSLLNAHDRSLGNSPTSTSKGLEDKDFSEYFNHKQDRQHLQEAVKLLVSLDAPVTSDADFRVVWFVVGKLTEIRFLCSHVLQLDRSNWMDKVMHQMVYAGMADLYATYLKLCIRLELVLPAHMECVRWVLKAYAENPKRYYKTPGSGGGGGKKKKNKGKGKEKAQTKKRKAEAVKKARKRKAVVHVVSDSDESDSESSSEEPEIVEVQTRVVSIEPSPSSSSGSPSPEEIQNTPSPEELNMYVDNTYPVGREYASKALVQLNIEDMIRARSRAQEMAFRELVMGE